MYEICEKCIQKKGLKQVTCVKFKIFGNGADWKSLNVDNCQKLRKFFISEIYARMHEKVKMIAAIDRNFPNIHVRRT